MVVAAEEPEAEPEPELVVTVTVLIVEPTVEEELTESEAAPFKEWWLSCCICKAETNPEMGRAWTLKNGAAVAGMAQY